MGLEFNPAQFFSTNRTDRTTGARNLSETTSTQASEAPKEIVTSNTVTRTSLDDANAISNKAKMNSPEAQGLASAQEIEKGQLIGPYHFNDLGPHNAKMFTLKYNSANVPSIANGTNYACENIEFTGVAGNLALAAKDSPFAELFS